MGKTTIEWTDTVWNPIRGCSRVSAGCGQCYAERVAARFNGPGLAYENLATMTKAGPRWTGDVRFIEDKIDAPLRWRKSRRIFVNSMSDIFHEKVPDEWIDRIFAVMAQTEQHTFQILTKRPKRMKRYCVAESEARVSRLCPNKSCFTFPSRNVWLGVSVEDQATAEERIPLLLQTPASVRWVSYEPALGPVDFSKWIINHYYCEEGNDEHPDPQHRCGSPGLHWLVVGGESGPGARPFDVAWARSVIAQCRAARVPVFVKQLGSKPMLNGVPMLGYRGPKGKGGNMSYWPADLRVREYPRAQAVSVKGE